MNLLTIKNLEFLHVGPLSFQVEAKQCVAISGSSGSGKTLILRALADLDDHLGDVILDDISQQEVKPHNWRRKVAMLSAESYWWFDTVGEHFDDIDQQQLEALGFDEDVSNWQISRLSSGEKQRLGLLRLLENNPQVLLLDEPTANLDKKNETLFENFVLEYLDCSSACAIWVSHDLEQINRVANKKYELKNGELF